MVTYLFIINWQSSICKVISIIKSSLPILKSVMIILVKLHLMLFDNVVVDMIKLILLFYNNFSIVKKIVNKIERVKLTLSRLPTNMKLLFNKLVLIKNIQKS